jgi:hypothetical protein
MKNKDFFNIVLPKWPAMVVVGRPVSQQQAMEIIIRTDDLHFGSNDHKFNKTLNEYFYDVKIDRDGWSNVYDAVATKLGISKEVKYFNELYDYMYKKRSEVGRVELTYLNNSRITSSWVGGAHGWCDWNGNIGCNNYNIGKWPSVEEVYNEWKLIAKAFPYLDLTCQLMNHESSCEDMVDDPKPLINFVVKKGKVKMKEPDGYLSIPVFPDFSYDIFRNERGCTIEQFKEAVDYCRNIFVPLSS